MVYQVYRERYRTKKTRLVIFTTKLGPQPGAASPEQQQQQQLGSISFLSRGVCSTRSQQPFELPSKASICQVSAGVRLLSCSCCCVDNPNRPKQKAPKLIPPHFCRFALIFRRLIEATPAYAELRSEIDHLGLRNPRPPQESAHREAAVTPLEVKQQKGYRYPAANNVRTD